MFRSGADDPERLRSPALCRFFGRIMGRKIAGAFHALRILDPGPPALPAGRPVIFVCNHPSWWDPALIIVLSTRLCPDRPAFGPMDAAALERYAFMKRIGLFGVEPDSRAGAARFLTVSTRLLSQPDHLLWITAQGRFTDPRERPIRLRPGVAHLMARAPQVVAVPVAFDYPFWTESRPEALVAFGPIVDGQQGGDAGAWATRLEAAMETTADRLTAAAVARDPAAFATLLEGSAGIGGVYDLWGRLRAALAGRRWSARHGTDAR